MKVIAVLALCFTLALSANFPLYKQCDSKWGSQILGHSSNTLCQAGCLVSSMSMALDGYGIRLNGQGSNPSTLNSWLKSNGGFQGALYVWSAVGKLGLSYKGKIANSEIKSYVARGNSIVILNVHNGGHYVLATGVSGNNILVNDPGYNTGSYALNQITSASVYTLNKLLRSFMHKLQKPAPLQASCGGCPDIQTMVAQAEGKRPCMYKDTMGIPTIGIGFNLNRGDARGLIQGLGLNYDDVKAGRKCLNDAQISKLFQHDLVWAKEGAAASVPSFGQQPSCVQNVLIDMTFNMGKYSLKQWSGFTGQLGRKDYQGAASNVQGTPYCRQVGNRCTRNVGILRSCHA